MVLTTTSKYYDGSLVLEPVAKAISLPIDQTNHIVCQLFCLLFGFVFRTGLSPRKVGPTVRHVIEFTLGLCVLYICFGRQSIHVVAQSMACYLAMIYLKPGLMEKVVLAISIGYLSVSHISRQIYEHGGHTVTITGPLMVNTQRLSSLAFALSDGLSKDEKQLSPLLKKHAVRKLPTLLEILSYTLSFHGALCGPFAFYNSFKAFIEGTDQHPPQSSAGGVDTERRGEASPVKAVLKLLLTAAICGILVTFVRPRFSADYLKDPEFAQRTFAFQMFYVAFCTCLARQKFYFVWTLAESANSSCGLGFNGYDEAGNSKWDLINNVNILKVETATSFKGVFDNWNIQTTAWVGHMIYERIHSFVLVFLFVAIWHGFYPGYYVSALTAGLMYQAARGNRRHIRPYFQTSATTRFIYDVITLVATQVASGYFTVGFHLLSFWVSVEVYSHMYFSLHVVAVVAIVVFSFMPRPKPKAKEE